MLFMTFTLHFPTTPNEIIKMCSIVSFDKLYNEYLGFRYNIPKRQLTDYFKAACLYHKYYNNYKLLNI